jgi:hypothetical protein
MNGRVFILDRPTHRAVQELLPWYASSQLPSNEAQLVEQHLHTCEQCRQDLQWERELHAQAQADIALDTPPHGVDVERAWARMMPALGAQDGVGYATARDGAAFDAATAGDVGAVSAAAPPSAAAAPHATDSVDTAETSADADRTGSATVAALVAGTGAGAALATRRWWRKDAANQPSWLRWTMAAQWVLIVGLLALLVRPDEPAAYRVLGNGAGSAGNLVVMFNPNTTERDLRRILQAQGARVVDGPTVTDAYLLNVPAEHRERALQALRGDPAVKLAEALDDGASP